MKRILSAAAAVLPALALLFFSVNPSADATARAPLFHFYVVTFTTFSAAVISILLSSAIGAIGQARHVLAAAAFAVVGSVFFSHGLATPGALIEQAHPAAQWSAWITLFGGGALFAAAGLDGVGGAPRWLPARRIVYAASAGVLAYSAIAAFTPAWLTFVDARAAPWHRDIIFAATFALWLLAAYRLWRTWRVTRIGVDGVLAFVAFWMAQATVSMHRFPVWKLSWWLYHAILLLGFLVTVYVLASAYEQARQFSLRRYFLAASLIASALLALAASALFSQFSFNTLVKELEASSLRITSNLAGEIAADLPADATGGDVHNLIATQAVEARMARHLASLDIGGAFIYDTNGTAAYASQPELVGTRVEDQALFEAALAGQPGAGIHPPEDPPTAYTPARSIHVIETYQPLRAANRPNGRVIGVLVVATDAPALSQATIQARRTGLLTAAVTMGLLFAALLVVVNRADGIITARTRELTAAYSDLRRAETMRDDLTQMIVHDLRNPLTAISASLDLLAQTAGKAGPSEPPGRLIGSARSASRRMTGLIDDLLTVGKIEAGELRPQFHHMALLPLFNERANVFAAQASAENKSLIVDCPPDLAAPLDPNLIGRVIENLIGNAFKYTENGGKIYVSARKEPENGRVRVSVRDDGEGVPDEHKERIFGKFVQAPHASGRPTRKGTGLGLAFCRLVIEQHGGRIWVEDTPGGGSDFIFWIPSLRGGS